MLCKTSVNLSSVTSIKRNVCPFTFFLLTIKIKEKEKRNKHKFNILNCFSLSANIFFLIFALKGVLNTASDCISGGRGFRTQRPSVTTSTAFNGYLNSLQWLPQQPSVATSTVFSGYLNGFNVALGT